MLALVREIFEIQGEFVSDIKSPDDSLSQYFDELLADDIEKNQQINLPLAVGDLSHSNVVSLSGRSKNIQTEKKTSLRETSTELPVRDLLLPSIKPLPHFAEPTKPDLQEQEKKQKLEKLLQTAQQQFLKQEQKVEPELKTLTTTFIDVPDEIQDWPIETTEEIAIETPVQAPVENNEQQILEETRLPEVANLEWAANGLPQWAQEKFDVLLFDVAGLTLAVPLIALGQIYPLTDDLTPLFGQADWFMGLQPTPMGKIRTVNTARFVMPEKYNETFLQKARYVMSLDGVPWGLALDSVNQPMRLDPDQVKWRSDRSKRPWLAGTVKEHMCALLDVPRIAQLLLEMDKNHKPG